VGPPRKRLKHADRQPVATMIKRGRFPHPAPPPSTAEDPVAGRADYVYVRG
jgi:hypothetical protein